MNGNGYTDILLRVTEFECTDTGPTTPGECFGVYYPVDRIDVYTFNPALGAQVEYTKTSTLGNLQNLRLADLNGDGLTDLVFNNGQGWRYMLSNGRYFMPSQSIPVPDNAGDRWMLQVVDLDGDGKSEILVPEGSSAWGLYVTATPMHSGNIQFTKRATINRVGGVQYRFADLNGNGLPEMLYEGSGNYWHVRKNILGSPARNSITQFTTGHGIRTRIHYSTLSNPNIYERPNSSQRDDGEFALYAGYSVVGTVEREVQENQFTQVRYRYGGLLVSRQGRGLLGFEFLTSEDMATGIATQTRYSQKFPFIGMPLASETRDLVGNFRLSYAQNTLAALIDGPTGSIYPYVAASKEYSYAIQRGLNGGITGSVPETLVESTFQFDVFGNLEQSTVTTAGFNAIGTPSAERTVVSTDNSYLTTHGLLGVGSSDKRLGRLSESSVTTTLVSATGNQSMTRSVSFTYRSDGLLASETTHLSGQADSLTTTYTYDVAGNIVQQSHLGTENGQALPIRVTKSTYDALFNRVIQRENAEGLVTDFSYELANGHIVKMTSTGANGNKSHKYFDTFGREYRSAVSFGSGSEILQREYVWTACGSCNAPNAVYKMSAMGGGKPTQWVYVDKFGREVRKETQLLTGQVGHIRTLYDHLGRVSRVYEPSFSTGSAYVEYTYDRYGNVRQTRAPNGGVTNITLSGLSTVERDAKGNTTTSTRDYAGRTVEVIDAGNNRLTYYFHPSGQISEV